MTFEMRSFFRAYLALKFCNEHIRGTPKRTLIVLMLLLSVFGLNHFLHSGTISRMTQRQKQNLAAEFERLLFYIQHPRTVCETALALGGTADDNKQVDGDKIICQQPGPALRKSCIVYSFGGNNEWSFEEAIEKFGCRVFTFDPSIREANHQHSSNIMFYRVGITDVNEDRFLLKEKAKWSMRTLDYIVKQLGHENETIDVLKLDIEGDEWKVLEQIMDSGAYKRILHLCVEVHLNSMDWERKWKILQRLENKAGFRFFSSRKNLVTKPRKVPGLVNRTEQLFYELAWYRDSGVEQLQ